MEQNNKVCVVTGALGQLASYLSELLLSKGYYVISTKRRASNSNYENVQHLLDNPNYKIVEMELTDYTSVHSVLSKYKPQEVYNLAAQSHVKSSFEQPDATFRANVIGPLNILEYIRLNDKNIRLFHCSTSEMFGKNYSTRSTSPNLLCDLGQLYNMFEKYQDENTELAPQSPYGISKLAAYHLIRLYRECYGVNCCTNIMFNAESPRRGKEFVTRKITSYIGQLVKRCSIRHTGLAPSSPQERIKIDGFVDVGQNNGFSFIPQSLKEFPKLKLGNLEAFRDWQFSTDCVYAMWLTLQQPKLDDYVICTGETRTVREFAENSFKLVGLDYKDFIEIDEDLFRPAEVDYLRGDASKAKRELGWTSKVSFDQLVKEMVYADIERAYNE